MLGNRKLVLDTFCEVYDLLETWADAEFWDLKQHLQDQQLLPGAVYLIGREQMNNNRDQIVQLANNNTITVVFCNPHEGSWTMIGQCSRLNIMPQVNNNNIKLITGGDMDSEYTYLQYDSFLPKVLDYTENIQAQADYHEQWTNQRPYKFLFLNGRARPHRQQLITQLQDLLSSTIWTNLDGTAGTVKTLGPEYEFEFYQHKQQISSAGYAKYELFDNQWGEIYLRAKPYLDTYFSLVTETVFDYPYSFRTEKIWKPIAIGHPFVAVANRGFYRDLHKLGFKTFGHLIDESFDLVDNNQDRLAHIEQSVRHLCQQDLASFADEAYNVCKYNQQHLAAMSVQVRKEFPNRFTQFIQDHP